MKAQNRKVINTAMRSPSPDIAHRSIITNTKSPANEIKQFMRMRQSSTSPQSMTTSFHQINKSSSDNQELNKLKKYIQQLQSRIKYLERIKISHQQLTIINQRLTGQVENLKLKTRQSEQRSNSNSSKNVSPVGRPTLSPRAKGVSLVKNQIPIKNQNSQSNPQIPSSAPTILAPTDNILRQFNERIVKMSEQNRRLGRKLQQVNEQKQNLRRQNSQLKGNNTFQNRTTVGESLIKDIDFLKRYFVQETQKITKYYQNLSESRMTQINSRVNGLQDELNRLTQKFPMKAGEQKTCSPLQRKTQTLGETYFRSQSYQQPYSTLQGNRYYMAESKYVTSPNQFKNVTLDMSPIRVLEEEKERIKRQNDGLNRKTIDIQTELKRVLLENNRLQRKIKQFQSSSAQQAVPSRNKKPTLLDESNISAYKESQQRIQFLEHELKTKASEIKYKTIQIEDLQKRLKEISTYRQNEAENQRKIIAQQKQKNVHFLQQLERSQQELAEMKKNTISRKVLQQLEEQLHRIKQLYDVTLLQQQQWKGNFSRYLQMVMEIRQSLTGRDVEECLRSVQNKWTGYDDLQMEIIKLHECHQMFMQEIQSYKQSILQKEQQIAKLQKQNLLLQEENQQNIVLVQKLQKAIFEYNQPSKTKMTEEQLKKKFIQHQSADKRNKQPCLIRDYINRTDSKLSRLQNQINAALRFQGQYQGQRMTEKSEKTYMQGNKNSFSPIEVVESVYRKTLNTQQQQEQLREYSDAQPFQDRHDDDIPDEYELMGRE